MRNFYDKDTDIYWLEMEKGDNKGDFESLNNIINDWHSPEIRRYVVQDTPVADFMTYYIDYVVGRKNNIVGCFCYYALDEDSKPLGIVEVSTNLEYPERAYLEYLVVNPKMTGRGIGTRMIKSIVNNTNWFVKNDLVDHWEVSIDRTNKPSQKAFLKNKFFVCQRAKGQSSDYGFKLDRYYRVAPKKSISPEMDK